MFHNPQYMHGLVNFEQLEAKKFKVAKIIILKEKQQRRIKNQAKYYKVHETL